MHKLKILFVSPSPSIFHYKSTLHAFLARGYQVRFLFDKKWTRFDGLLEVKEIFKDTPEVEFRPAVDRSDRWKKLLFYTRELRSYQRYLFVKNQSSFYRDRWKSYLPRTARRLFSHKTAEKLFATNLVRRLLAGIERLTPADKSIMDDIRAYAPHAILASPTNVRFSPADLEYLKAGKALGIPSLVLVSTWDNLTTKGLLQVWPDRLLVWNAAQIREAKEFHFFPEERIRVTGAPPFDSGFSRLKPSSTRREFCLKNDLREQDPILVYLGSSRNMAKDESWLIEKLRKALDQSGDKQLESIQMIVRPHPGNPFIYKKIKLKDVIALPKEGGQFPSAGEPLQLLYDTFYHSFGVVVGVNTSAIIEAIIFGKPSLAFLTAEYRKTQVETQHFRQLMENDVLELADNPEAFLGIVKKILNGRDSRKSNRENFVRRYIRPLGLELSAGEAVTREIEKLVREKAANNRQG